jgi:hypothetical protein
LAFVPSFLKIKRDIKVLCLFQGLGFRAYLSPSRGSKLGPEDPSPSGVGLSPKMGTCSLRFVPLSGRVEAESFEFPFVPPSGVDYHVLCHIRKPCNFEGSSLKVADLDGRTPVLSQLTNEWI